MQKLILTPEECGELIPHWYDLNDKKLARLLRMTTRISNFLPGEKHVVMSATPILITDDRFILNGRHRSYIARKYEYCLEAYEVVDPRDIIHHTPHKSYGETGFDGVLEAYERKYLLISMCGSRGVTCINDLVRIYSKD